jgi:antitoxin component YwqK of YwqJK toxin-antitoxin module
MKNLITLCFFFLVTAASAQTLNEKGFYIDNEGNLFSGVITAMNNNVKSEMEVKAGVISGKADYYYANGRLMESGMMVNGLKDGQWTRFAENGFTSAIGFYSVGKKSGTWTVFDETGKKRMEMNYNNTGEKTGTWTSWDEKGIVSNTKTYGGAN